jgi:ASC-1-like (ASCH) protein
MKRILRFRTVNKDIWQAVKDGTKTVETRAATPRYQSIKVGDSLVFVCGSSRFEKIIYKTRLFKTPRAVARAYGTRKVHPGISTIKELGKMYLSFPGYAEKIDKYGIIAFEL